MLKDQMLHGGAGGDPCHRKAIKTWGLIPEGRGLQFTWSSSLPRQQQCRGWAGGKSLLLPWSQWPVAQRDGEGWRWLVAQTPRDMDRRKNHCTNAGLRDSYGL